MALSADEVVVDVVARFDATQARAGAAALESMTRAIAASGASMEQSVGQSATKVVDAHQRMGASGLILNHIVRSTADQFASGTPAAQIFAQHIAQLGEAAALSGNSMGAFGAIMSGPWGIAISAGISLATVLGARLLGAGDSVESLVEKKQHDVRQSAMNAEADVLWRNSLEGLTATIRDQNQALADRLRLQSQVRDADLNSAQSDQASLEDRRRDVLHRLSEARTAARGTSNAPQVGIGQGAGMGTNPAAAAAAAAVANLEKELNDIQVALLDGADRIRRAEIQRNAAISTAQGRIEDEFDRQLAALREQRLNGQISNDEEAAGERRIGAARAAATQRASEAEAAEHRLNDTRQNGRHITEAQAAAIVHSIGGTVTSSTRSHAEQAHLYAEYRAGRGPLAAAPGTSAHERGTAIDIVGASIGQVREAFRAAGVSLRQLLLETNPRTGAQHVHADFGAGGRGPSAETVANRERAARLRQTHLDDGYDQELSAAQDRLLQAQQDHAHSAEEQAAISLQQVDTETHRRTLAIQGEVNEGRRTRAQGDILQALNAMASEEQKGVILRRQQQQMERETLEIRLAGLDDQRNILQGQERLAETSRERLAIELRLIDIAEREERARLAGVLAFDSDASAKERAVALIQYQSLPQRTADQREAARRQNRGPLDEYFARIPQTADAMNEALQHVAVDGLQQLNDGLAQAATRFLHLGGVAGDVLNTIIGDMVRLILQQAELAAFGGGKGGGLGGIFSTILGGLQGGAGAGGAGKFTDYLIGFAGGGAQTVGGIGGTDNNVVSVNGQPRFRASGDETLAVIPQGKALSFHGGQAASPMAAGAPQRVTIHVQSTGDFEAKVVEISGHVAVEVTRAAAPQIMAGAKADTIRAITRPGLNRQ